MALPTRNLGQLTTSALGYGCMSLSEFYGEPLPKNKAIRIIQEAYEQGITLFDTADMYGYGENEKLIGEAIKPFRDKITLATKCGIIRRKDDPTARGVDNTPDYIMKSCDESLKRLNIDTIDLFYIHRRNPETPIEDVVGAMADLIKSGKILHIGLSEVDAETIQKAHKVHPITAIQTEYSLWTRTVENNAVLETCKSLNIGFVAYSPLGRGFLTGAIKNPANLEKSDFRRTLPRFAEKNIGGNLKLVEFIEIMAKQKNCTAAQLSLAWLLSKEKFIVPLFGTKTPARLAENLNATGITLTSDEIIYLNKISKEYAPQQSRYTDAAMQMYKLAE